LQNYAQDQQLAFQYFRNGEYEKAASIYKPLHQQNPYNSVYLTYLIDCYQQLQQFDEVVTLVNKQLSTYKNQEYLFVEIGYNYQLQYNQIKAEEYYKKAIEAITISPNFGYIIGKTFQDNHLLDYALLAYKKAMEINSNSNYNFQIALIYGEKAEIENMFNTYIEMVSDNDTFLPSIKNYIGRYITDDAENEANVILRKLLLKRIQNNPEIRWNNLLSWLFMQQKDYTKALVQEKAIFKRNAIDINPIFEIGKIAFEDNNYEAAKNCFVFVLENNKDLETELTSKLYLLEIDLNSNVSYENIENQFQQLFIQYGKNINTIGIQATYAEFLAFKRNNPENGISILKEALKFPLNEFQIGHLKTKLADILEFTGKFSSDLIYYTQV